MFLLFEVIEDVVIILLGGTLVEVSCVLDLRGVELLNLLVVLIYLVHIKKLFKIVIFISDYILSLIFNFILLVIFYLNFILRVHAGWNFISLERRNRLEVVLGYGLIQFELIPWICIWNPPRFNFGLLKIVNYIFLLLLFDFLRFLVLFVSHKNRENIFN